MRYRSGRLLFQRLGHLNAVRQDLGFCQERSPERKGIWAFPWPYFESFYAWHKFDEVLPRELRRESLGALTGKETALRKTLASAPANDPVAAAQLQLEIDELTAEASSRWERRERWIEEKGRSTLPLRKFWYQGLLYTHLDLRGRVLGYNDWQLLTASQFFESASRLERAGVRYQDYAFEVFIPRRGGKIS